MKYIHQEGCRIKGIYIVGEALSGFCTCIPLEVNGVPICQKCGEEMIQAYDEVEKKISYYLWECKCSPDVKLSIG